MKWFRFLLAKRYFDAGYGLTGYLKYVIALVGIGAAIQDIPLYMIFLMGMGYGIFCYILGRFWHTHDLVRTEMELNNLFNPFVHEVRDKLKIPNKRNI